MAELFVNYIAQTTLAEAIGPTQSTIEIIPVAASPSSPQFRIRVDNEIMLVTAVAGPTYTVTRGIEGTTAAAHDREIVHYILTAAALGGQSDPAPSIPGLRSLGTSANQAAAGNDPRFSTSLPPLAHATTHHSGGSDPLVGQSIAGLLTSSTPTFAGLTIGNNASSDALVLGYSSTEGLIYNAHASGVVWLGAGANYRWQLEAAGHLRPALDNVYDIGNVNYRIRTGYFGTSLALASSANLNWNGDTVLIREGANTLAMRNGVNGQRLFLYGSYTDAANNYWLDLGGESGFGAPIILARASGAHIGRSLLISATTDYGGSGVVYIHKSHLVPGETNLWDLGSSAGHWRTGYFGTSLALSSSANLNWNGDTFLRREQANYLIMKNGASVQNFAVCGFYTDASNFSWVEMTGDFGGSGPMIRTYGVGTGVGRHLFLSNSVAFWNGSGNIYIHDSNLLPWDNNTRDCGASNAQWRTGYFGTSLALSSTANLNWNGDVRLYRDAANALGIRNGANAQNLNVHFFYTDAANWHRLRLHGGGIRQEGAGSGVGAANMEIRTDAHYIDIYLANTLQWEFYSAGRFLPWADNANDIGQANRRVRTLYMGTSLLHSGFVEFTEMGADAAAGTANTARLFAKDNGSGKTQLCVRFNTGAVAILATEP